MWQKGQKKVSMEKKAKMCHELRKQVPYISTANKQLGEELGRGKRDFTIKPSQMEVAPLHRTLVISHKRRLFKNTKGI